MFSQSPVSLLTVILITVGVVNESNNPSNVSSSTALATTLLAKHSLIFSFNLFNLAITFVLIELKVFFYFFDFELTIIRY